MSDYVKIEQALAIGDLDEALPLDVEEAFRIAAEEALAEAREDVMDETLAETDYVVLESRGVAMERSYARRIARELYLEHEAKGYSAPEWRDLCAILGRDGAVALSHRVAQERAEYTAREFGAYAKDAGGDVVRESQRRAGLRA